MRKLEDNHDKLIKKAIELERRKTNLVDLEYFKYQRIIYIITDQISTSTYRNLNKYRNYVSETIKEIKENVSNENILSFLEFKEKVFEKFKNKQILEEYLLIATLNVDNDTTEFLISNSDILKNAKLIQNDFISEFVIPFDKEWIRIALLKQNKKISDLYSYTWLGLPCFGDSKNNAFLNGYDILEKARSIFNFSILKYSIHFQSNPQKFTKIIPSPIFFLLNKKNEYQFMKYTIGEYDYTFKSALLNSEQEKISNMNNVLKIIKKNSLKEKIYFCMELYNQAMDTFNREYTFIVLWTIIDILLPDIKKNVELIKYLTPNNIEENGLLIKALYNKRNLLIHQGEVNIFEIDDINHLKSMIDNLILWALDMCKFVNNTYELLEGTSKNYRF